MKAEIEIKDEMLIDVLESADIAYWGDFHERSWAEKILGSELGSEHITVDAYQFARSAYRMMLNGQGEIAIEEEETHDAKQKTQLFALTGEKIKTALQIIAVKWPWHFKDIMTDGGGDATTGDVLIQVAIFGDIIYG
jgi:hypothetical protein